MIRKARIRDVRAIQRLVNFYASMGQMLPRSLNEIYERVREFIVWEEGGEVVGVCSLAVYWEDLAEIRSLAVHRDFNGKGIGKALTHACLAEAGTLGIARVFALTYKPEFFTRLGFRVVDKMDLPQKIWKDCLKCSKFHDCDEVAVLLETGALPPASPPPSLNLLRP